MRVSAPRPRHTSQGEEKDKPSNAENDKAENETQEKGDSENVQETNSREETTLVEQIFFSSHEIVEFFCSFSKE